MRNKHGTPALGYQQPQHHNSLFIHIIAFVSAKKLSNHIVQINTFMLKKHVSKISQETSLPQHVRARKHTIQIIGRDQQFQTKLRRNMHVRHILLILVFMIIQEISRDLFQNNGTTNKKFIALAY